MSNFSKLNIKLLDNGKEEKYMIDNTQDNGQLMVHLREIGDDLHLCGIGLGAPPATINFNVQYGSGTIYVDWNDGSPREIIGYYETVASSPLGARVFDDTNNVIGWVGNEMVYFRSSNGDSRECLAYYSKTGRIMPINNLLSTVGHVDGSEIGGAAAFIAIFFRYNFKSIYRDYLEMGNAEFKKVYASYFTL